MKNSTENPLPPSAPITMPKRTIGVEFLVGLFTLGGVVAAGALSVGLGGFTFAQSQYPVYATFDNISGLTVGASVELAGVPVGAVTSISLRGSQAQVTLGLKNDFVLRDEDLLQIRTKGIIGDRYVKIVPGDANAAVVGSGSSVSETESVVDFEDLIGKFVHSFSEGKSEESKESKK